MRPRRSWSSKLKLEMIVIVLRQQLDSLKRYYPNYAGSIEMLRRAIDSFESGGNF